MLADTLVENGLPRHELKADRRIGQSALGRRPLSIMAKRPLARLAIPANRPLLRFETLTNEPARAVAAVYAFIGEPAFSHDFNNVRYEADEFDRRIGSPGLHAVRPKVEPVARASVLPPDLFSRYETEAFWLDPALNSRKVKVV